MRSVLILGATGRTGQLVIEELSQRANIQIVAALRKPEDRLRLPKLSKPIETVLVDTDRVISLKEATKGIDVIVHAIRLRGEISANSLVELDQRIRAAIADRKEIPLIIVGGAGALIKNDGSHFWQDSRFPEVTLPRGIAHEKLRNHLDQHSFKDPWTYLIPPPAYLADGKRVGTYQKYRPFPSEQAIARNIMSLQPAIKFLYRTQIEAYKSSFSLLSEEDFLTKTISYADFAVAVADAVEKKWQGTYMIAAENNENNLPFLD